MNIEIVIAIVGISIVVGLLAHGFNKLSAEKSESKHYDGVAPSSDLKQNDTHNHSGQSTHELMIQVLGSLNCVMHPDEDNEGWFNLEFQRGHFSIAFDGPWVRLIYPFWYTIELSDIDKLSSVRRLINEMNQLSRGHLLTYVINEERHEVYVHTMSHFIFTGELTNLADYLSYYLGYCFTIRQEFERRLSMESTNK